MRLTQQIRASIARRTVAGAALAVFVSGTAVSAFGQTARSQAAAPAPATTTVQGTPLSMDEAVRMALENNLNIQVEKLNPQISVLGIARANAAYAPTLFSSLSRRNSTSPPTDFLTALSAGGANVVTNGSFVTTGGIGQQLRFGGASYSLSLDGSRATSTSSRSPINPQLGSNLNAAYTQPLLRNFKIDSARQQLLLSQNTAAAADIQLQQRVTQTSRNVRAAYYTLIGAIHGLDVAQQSLDVARTSLKNNQTRVEVGTMAQIDIVQAEAEVAANEESVIVATAQIESAQDLLRTLVMNPSQPDFWTTRFTPSEQPTMLPRAIDVDAAVKNALQNRTDIREFKKTMESTDISMAYARNQKLPAVDLTARYGLTGVAGTQLQFDDEGSQIGQSVRAFSSALRDVFANDFKTWSVAVNVSYPLGTSQADASYAQGKLQQQQERTTLANLEMAVTTEVRQVARDVNTNLRRIEATRRARELAEQRLTADNKRFSVGLATTFEVLQSQRDLSRAKQNELRALIDYNRSLVDFEAVQISPIR